MTNVAFVIDDEDIFKYVVSEHPELSEQESFNNGRKLLQRIPINIFKDEYNILYDCLRSLSDYNRAFSYDSVQQVTMNNKYEILDDNKITIGEDIDDETERFDLILQSVLTVYGDLCEEEVPDLTFAGNLELYVDNWANFKFEELLFEVDQINKNGFKIGRNTLRGRKDADYHYKQVTSIINSIVDADANLLAESVDTSIQSAEEIEEIHNRNEIQQENLGVTGIEAIDSEMIGMFKGEMIVIQGGSGSGKSRLATALGKQILNNGKNVLFISLEQKANRIFSMFHSRHILEVQGVNRITDKDLIRQSYSPLDEHIVKSAREDLVENQNIGRLRIEGKYVKAKDIMMELETIWEDFKFDAVVLDYFGLLGTEKDRYNELTDAINLLKSACKSFKGEGFSLIVPNQLSREAEKELLSGKKEEAGIGGSESAYLFRGADIVITINRPKDLTDDNQMELIISKMRLGTAIQPIKVITDFGHCIFTQVPSEDEEDDDNPFA